jgi:anaerobic selenocysteine-containing dehydrogenase
MVKVRSKRGATRLPAKVTPRIMPGVASMEQGAWYKPDAGGIDVGGSINVLTSQRPSPLAKGNPQHTNLVQIEKA